MCEGAWSPMEIYLLTTLSNKHEPLPPSAQAPQLQTTNSCSERDGAGQPPPSSCRFGWIDLVLVLYSECEIVSATDMPCTEVSIS